MVEEIVVSVRLKEDFFSDVILMEENDDVFVEIVLFVEGKKKWKECEDNEE